jgi:flagellar motor component MotA
MTSNASNAMEDSSSADATGINLSGILSFVLIIFLVVVAILMGGSPGIFLNIPSAVIVVGETVALVLISCGAKELFRALLTLRIVVAHLPGDALRQRDADVLRALTIYCYASAVIGTMIGAVQMLIGLEDINMLGPSVAVSLLTVFYTILLSEALLRPVARMIERGLHD